MVKVPTGAEAPLTRHEALWAPPFSGGAGGSLVWLPPARQGLTSTTRKPAASTWRRAITKRPSSSLLRLLKLGNSQRKKATLGEMGCWVLTASPNPRGNGGQRGAKGQPGAACTHLLARGGSGWLPEGAAR